MGTAGLSGRGGDDSAVDDFMGRHGRLLQSPHRNSTRESGRGRAHRKVSGTVRFLPGIAAMRAFLNQGKKVPSSLG